MILHHELRAMNDMNDSRSWTQGSRCCKQHKVVVDMNDFGSRTQGFKCNEKIQAMKDINDSRL